RGRPLRLGRTSTGVGCTRPWRGGRPARARRGSPIARDYAEIWQAADKIVYSTPVPAPATRKIRIERRFDPDAVGQLKADTPDDLGIGGAGIAAAAFETGLVDEVQLVVAPVSVGGGTRCLPDRVRLDLEIVDTRRFDS